MEQVSWHVIEIIQVRNDDDVDQYGSTGIGRTDSDRIWSDLENVLKIEPVKLTDELAMGHGRERRVKYDQIFWLRISMNAGAF